MVLSKKSQFFVLSGMLLFMLLIFIYSLETENSYISKFSEVSILNNLVYETCVIGKNSNGTQIDGRLTSFSLNVSDYCDSRGNYCNLVVIPAGVVPPSGNWSLLNYTYYSYHIDYQWNGFSTSFNFSC